MMELLTIDLDKVNKSSLNYKMVLSSMSILDQSPNWSHLLLKEATYIKRLKPIIKKSRT